MLEALLRDAQLHEAWDEVARLRAQLHPQPLTQVSTEPQPEPVKPVRISKRRRKPPSSSSLTRQQRVNAAWEVLKLKHGD
jgi:hypothetical protein